MSSRAIVTTVTIQADGLLAGDVVQLPAAAGAVPPSRWRRHLTMGASWHRLAWVLPGDSNGLPTVLVKTEGYLDSDGENREGFTRSFNSWDLVAVQVVDGEHSVPEPRPAAQDLEARVSARRELAGPS